MDPTRIGATPKPAELSHEQTLAMERLRDAAQQLEGVFIGMLFKEMKKTQSDHSITGKKSPGTKMFEEMLDDERAKAMAKQGGLGISKILEEQLKAAVLGNSTRESKTPTDGGGR